MITLLLTMCCLCSGVFRSLPYMGKSLMLLRDGSKSMRVLGPGLSTGDFFSRKMTGKRLLFPPLQSNGPRGLNPFTMVETKSEICPYLGNGKITLCVSVLERRLLDPNCFAILSKIVLLVEDTISIFQWYFQDSSKIVQYLS